MPTSEGGYKQFKIGDLFEKIETKSLNYKVKDLPVKPEGEFTLPALTAGIINQGLSCFVPRTDATILQNVISVSANGANTGAMFFQPEYFTVLQDSYAIKLKDGDLNEYSALYFIAAMGKVINKYYDWSNKAGWNKIKELVISVPINNSKNINFDYIELLVRALKDERVQELDEYLNAASLSDCTLTEAEEKAINTNIENITLHPFKMEKLFYKPNLSFRKKKFNKKEDVSTIRNSEYTIPLVNAKHGNNGIMYYGREQDYDTIEMAVDIVNDGAVATGDVYPQPQKTGVLYNAYLIKLIDDVATESILMYYAATIQKNIKLLFSYQNKAGWEKVKNCSIFLPVTNDGAINYEFMENYITAIKKRTISRVKEYIKQEHSFIMDEPIEQTIIPLVYPEYKPGFIPLYTLRAACGYFDEGQLPEEEGWIDASGLGFTPDPKRHFAVHAKGDSMLPKIKDGDLCIFEWYTAGSRNGEIVLTQSSEYDSEYGGRYTIKRYHSEKIVTDEGWQHTSVQLLPLNKDYEPIELDEFGEYRTVGIFKCILN